MAQIRFATFPPKDPEEKKDYSFDWTQELKNSNASITGSTWIVTGSGLTQSSGAQSPSFDAKTTTVWYEAGTAGTDYVITNRITDDQGRTHEASAVLPCRSAGA